MTPLSNTSTSPIDGSCEAGFEQVRQAFEDNFADGHETGACVSVVIRGRTVVDLWGGYRDGARSQPWQRDTLVTMMSVTKAITALCVLLLVDRGKMELDAPVARYWPEFARNGKQGITVRHVLAQLAGMPYVDALERGQAWDTAAVARAIEAQTPEWPAGSMPCYHSFSAGLMYAELIRRVDGRSVGRFLHDEVGEPFGIDFHVGLSPAEDKRRAEYITTPGTPSLEGISGRNQASPLARAWRSFGADKDYNAPDWRFREFPSGNGHGTARGVARLYSLLACGGGFAGERRLISQRTLDDALREQWDGIEAMTKRHFRFATGFMLVGGVFAVGPNRLSFGHPGVGGACSFGDPALGLGMAYAPNHMAPVADLGPYMRRLIDAVYTALAESPR